MKTLLIVIWLTQSTVIDETDTWDECIKLANAHKTRIAQWRARNPNAAKSLTDIVICTNTPMDPSYDLDARSL